MGQRKAFYRQRIPKSICAREQIIDIDILVTSRIGDRENMQICQDNEQTSLEKKEVEQTEPVLKNIYQTNTYKKGLSWPHFDDETWIQRKKEAWALCMGVWQIFKDAEQPEEKEISKNKLKFQFS